MCQGLRQNLRITARDMLEFLVRQKATDTDALCFGILFLKKIFQKLDCASFYLWSLNHTFLESSITLQVLRGCRGIGVCGPALRVTRPGAEPHCDALRLSPHVWAYLITTEVSVQSTCLLLDSLFKEYFQRKQLSVFLCKLNSLNTKVYFLHRLM